MTDTQKPLSAEELRDYSQALADKASGTWSPDEVRKLLATIDHLQAQVAVLVEAAGSLCEAPVDMRDTFRLEDVLSNLPAAATALLKELSIAKEFKAEWEKLAERMNAELKETRADRDHWKERAEKAEANQRTPAEADFAEIRATANKFSKAVAKGPIRQENYAE